MYVYINVSAWIFRFSNYVPLHVGLRSVKVAEVYIQI
jgi:hypothetical protein